MKKHIYIEVKTAFSFFCCLLLACCTMEVPESISIKAKAKHTIPVGMTYFDIEDYLSAKDIQDMISTSQEDGKKIQVYEHYRDDEVKSYLAKVPIESFDLDVGNMLSEFLKDSDFSQLSYEKSFCIPSLNAQNQKTLYFDVANQIFNICRTSFDFSLVSPGQDNIILIADSALPPDLPSICIPMDFSSVYDQIDFVTGGMVIHIEDTESQEGQNNADISLFLEAYLFDSQDNLICQSGNVDVSRGGDLILSLLKKSITGDSKIILKGSISGGQAGSIHKYSASIAMQDDSRLQSIEGLCLSGITIPLDFSMPLSQQEEIYEMKLGEGLLAVVGDSNTQGINCKIDDFSTTGGLETTKDDWTFLQDKVLDATLDLAGKQVKPLGVDFHFEFGFDFSDAILIFDSDGMFPMQISATLEVKKLDSATMRLPHDMTSFDVPLSSTEQMKNMIKQITFNPNDIKLSGNIYNGLPQGNDITFLVDCADFSLRDTKTFHSGQQEDFSFSNKDSVTISPVPAELLMNVRLVFPSQAQVDEYDTFTLSGMELDKVYTLKTQVDFEFGFDSVTLLLDGIGQGGYEGDFDIDVDVEKICDGLDDNIKEAIDFDSVELISVPIYLYMTKPSFATTAFDGMTFRASAYLSSDDGRKDLIDDETQIGFVKAAPVFFDDYVEGDLPQASFEDTTSIAQLVNQKAKNVKFVYSINLEGTQQEGVQQGEITFYSSSIKSLDKTTDTTKIQICAILEVPLEFRLKKDLELNILELADVKVDDLLGRKDVEDGEYDKIVDTINSIGVSFTVDNNLVRGFDSSITMINYHYFESPKTIDIGESGSQMICLDRQEATRIINTWPFLPELIYTIRASNRIYVLKGRKETQRRFTLYPRLLLDIDGTYEVWSK